MTTFFSNSLWTVVLVAVFLTLSSESRGGTIHFDSTSFELGGGDPATTADDGDFGNTGTQSTRGGILSATLDGLTLELSAFRNVPESQAGFSDSDDPGRVAIRHHGAGVVGADTQQINFDEDLISGEVLHLHFSKSILTESFQMVLSQYRRPEDAVEIYVGDTLAPSLTAAALESVMATNGHQLIDLADFAGLPDSFTDLYVRAIAGNSLEYESRFFVESVSITPSIFASSTTSVPEPETLLTMFCSSCVGLGTLVFALRRQRGRRKVEAHS